MSDKTKEELEKENQQLKAQLELIRLITHNHILVSKNHEQWSEAYVAVDELLKINETNKKYIKKLEASVVVAYKNVQSYIDDQNKGLGSTPHSKKNNIVDQIYLDLKEKLDIRKKNPKKSRLDFE